MDPKPGAVRQCDMPQPLGPCAGAMGTRTVHQLDSKAQMVVQVLRQGAGEDADSGDEASALDAVYEGSALAADMKVPQPRQCQVF